MYKLSIREIEMILGWYAVAQQESQTNTQDDELAKSLESFSSPYEDFTIDAE